MNFIENLENLTGYDCKKIFLLPDYIKNILIFAYVYELKPYKNAFIGNNNKFYRLELINGTYILNTITYEQITRKNK